MNIQLNTAASSMRELQKKVDVIANNIANVSTTGYKRHEANFSDTLVQSIDRQAGVEQEIGRLTPNGLRIGNGVKITQTSIQNNQGSLQQTGRELDFAISGDKGFFRVTSGENIYYTRDGAFQLQPVLNSNQLALVTSAGDNVLDLNNNPITFDNDLDKIEVNPNGTIRVSYGDPTKADALVQLGIVQVNRPNLLEKVGANRYQLPGAEDEQAANGTLEVINLAEQNDGTIKVNQGMLEMSNVDLTEELTDLITTQRLLQSQGRAISFADDMMGLVNNMKG